jgi:hypothetical protein
MTARQLALDVIIRIRDSDELLPRTFEFLALYGIKPQIILIDNGTQKTSYAENGFVKTWLPYPLPLFNYAMAINMGLPFLDASYCLIISPHTYIQNFMAIPYAMEFLDENSGFAGLCFSDSLSQDSLSVKIVSKTNFNGWNGLWNTASIYRSSLLRLRPFNPECFSAEDQEWSRWAIFDQQLHVGHVRGCETLNANHKALSFKKRLREWACISYFVHNEYLAYKFILETMSKSLRLFRVNPKEAAFWFFVSLTLFKARFVKPSGSSAYY